MIQSLTFIEAGYSEQIERFVNPETGKWTPVRFPSSVAAIEHKTEGVILFDTGYTPKIKQVMKYFPEKLYSLGTPITIEPEDTALYQLNARGIQSSDVGTVILSHFHADHVAGILDYPSSQVVFSKPEFTHFKKQASFFQVAHGFLEALLPSDLNSRNRAYGKKKPLPSLGRGWSGYDLFADESIFLVPLPGHTLGHLGLYLPDVKGEAYFLVGDAAWLQSSILENVLPVRLVQNLIFYDLEKYESTLDRLHSLSASKLNLVPCHCHQTLKKMNTKLVKS